MLNDLKAVDLLKNGAFRPHEAELVLRQILNISRLELYLNKPSLNPAQYLKFEQIKKNRLKGKPLQYLLGEVEFFGLPFKVSSDVLIPRPETEVLVESVVARFTLLHPESHGLKSADEWKIKFESTRKPRPKGQGVTGFTNTKNKLKILDLCTGSGVIAISLANNLLNAEVTASDISSKALKVAYENAKLNQVDSRIAFIKSDIFENINTEFDIIAVNPPYIPTNEIPKLAKEISFEPRIALDGGRDGLKFYRKIFESVDKYLNKGGVIFIEMGENQKEAVEKILGKNKKFKLSQVIKDYANRERVLEIKRI